LPLVGNDYWDDFSDTYQHRILFDELYSLNALKEIIEFQLEHIKSIFVENESLNNK